MLINPPHSDIVGWILEEHFLEDCWVFKLTFFFKVVVKVLNRASVTFPVVPQSIPKMVLLESPGKIGKGTLDCVDLVLCHFLMIPA